MLDGIGAPLRIALFRRIWLASLMSNFGLMIHGVGAAWAMTQLTTSADMVALVQTALMLPVMLLSVTAGAVADMFDRRKVGLVALSIGFTAASVLSILAALGLLTPTIILAFTFLIGSGMALFGPSWQASVSEQVPGDMLPSAVALSGISYNLARSFGPALGGVIVATAGSMAAFICNAVLYLPLVAALATWRRVVEPSRLPPERLSRAIVSGMRYVVHSPSLRIVLWRTLSTGIGGSSILALMPLIARDLLGGGAQTFGIMLGAFGMGAVIGALNVGSARKLFSTEAAIRLCLLTMGLGVGTVALSRIPVLTAAALVVAGAGWTLSITLFNVAIQLSAPRWVAGRALATFQAAIAGGVAIGSWGWGRAADAMGTGHALMLSAAVLLALPALGLWLRLPASGGRDEGLLDPLADPEVHLSITSRSGPIVIEIDYRIDPERARLFYGVMQAVQGSRQRNGAYDWSLSRDLADPEKWTERYHCPTWADYLRQRNRPTQAERALHQSAIAFHLGPDPIRVRRMLERPFGSVRWKDETPDRGDAGVMPAPSNLPSGA